jgi:hypothetical protein|nr:MAG TPA: hypothetical protein [Caudoviricetes sp.]
MSYQCQDDEIFVFGSNLAGIHGKGAALTARQLYGAKLGQGWGLQGRSFAIPTKDSNLKPLPLSNIEKYVNVFYDFVRSNPKTKFFVTAIGCGLAGYKHFEIAPMFLKFKDLDNVRLPDVWIYLYNAIESLS